jgi:hypothetical protein
VVWSFRSGPILSQRACSTDGHYGMRAISSILLR